MIPRIDHISTALLDRPGLFPDRDRWADEARCAGLDPETADRYFFPNAGQGYLAEARRMCAGCPVRQPCENAGRETVDGMWGGLTPIDRGFQDHRGRDRHRVRARELRDLDAGRDSLSDELAAAQ